MVCKVTINNFSVENKKVLRLDDEGNFESLSLPEVSKATVHLVKDNVLSTYVPKRFTVLQEYEKDPFTQEQNTRYKHLLHNSQTALLIINKLKNSRLITIEQFEQELKGCLEKTERKALIKNKFIQLLFQQHPVTIKPLRLDVEAQSFNRLPLRYLGITKADVMTAFKTAGLI